MKQTVSAIEGDSIAEKGIKRSSYDLSKYAV